MRRSYSFSFETREKCERFAFPFEPKKNLSEFIKLNFFIFVRDGGKCEHFAFRFVPKKMLAKLAHPTPWIHTEEENCSWYVGEDGGVEAGREVRVLCVPGKARFPQHAPAQVGITKENHITEKAAAAAMPEEAATATTSPLSNATR